MPCPLGKETNYKKRLITEINDLLVSLLRQEEEIQRQIIIGNPRELVAAVKASWAILRQGEELVDLIGAGWECEGIKGTNINSKPNPVSPEAPKCGDIFYIEKPDYFSPVDWESINNKILELRARHGVDRCLIKGGLELAGRLKMITRVGGITYNSCG